MPSPSATTDGGPAAPTRRALGAGGGLLAALLVGQALEARAGARPPGQDRPRADVDALDAAIAAGDAVRLERLLHPELLWIRGSGAVAGKAEFLRAMANPDLRIEPFKSSRTRLYAAADLELWTGLNVLRGTLSGEPFVDRHHFADLWRLRGGRWRLTYIQVTPAPEPDASSSPAG